MDEYISREAVVRYLKGYSEKELNHSGHFGMITSGVLNKVERAISEMPAADVQPVNSWISVEDRMPEQYEEVLVYSAKYGVQVDWIADKVDNKYFWWNYGELVTHWQPKPEPPEKPYQEWDRIAKEREDAVH